MTEGDFQAQIRKLAGRHREEEEQYLARSRQQDDDRREMEARVAALFTEIAANMVAADDHLEHDDGVQGKADLAVSYNKRTNATRPTFHATAVCSADSVDINVSDGHWAQVPGTLGAFADWTDQRKVYSGPFDPAAIRQSVEHALLAWYARAMAVPDEPPTQ